MQNTVPYVCKENPCFLLNRIQPNFVFRKKFTFLSIFLSMSFYKKKRRIHFTRFDSYDNDDNQKKRKNRKNIKSDLWEEEKLWSYIILLKVPTESNSLGGFVWGTNFGIKTLLSINAIRQRMFKLINFLKVIFNW